MATRSPPFQIGDIGRAEFRTSRECDAENGRLQKALGFTFRYQPARLAIGRSLRIVGMPEPSSDLLGKPIRGDTLFGQDETDIGLWASLVAEHSGQAELTRKDLQEMIGAHWARGIVLLSRIFDDTAPEPATFFDCLLHASDQGGRQFA